MILTLDIGNSTIKSIVYDREDQVLYQHTSKTYKEADKQFYLEYFAEIEKALTVSISKIIMSSVVPKITETVYETLSEVFKLPVINVDTSLAKHLNIELDKPEELGADFIATAYAALERYQQPTIIVDLGSASKISVVDVDETFLGGIIQPGIELMVKTLHQEIPHLPKIDISYPENIIGHDTVSSINSGIVMGTWYGMVGITNQIEKQLARKCVRLLTGGLSNLYKDKDDFIHLPDLVNEGLLAILRRYELYE